MRTNLVQTCKTSANRINLNRTAMRVALIGLFISLGIGNVWAGSSTTYYANLTISKTGETGKGKVYYATSNSKPSSETSGALQSAGSTTQNANQTYYWWVDVDPGYNVTVSGKITAGPATAATLSGNVACAQSSSSGNGTSYSATANIVAVTVNSVDETSINLAPTNPSIDYPFTVTFATSNLKTIALDLNKSPETADGKFTITSWAQDGNNVVATGKFNGGDSYGGASRNHSTTVSLQSKASGSAAKTCTVTANFPALAFVSSSATEVFATQGESGKTGSATFKYNYAAEDDFPTAPTLTPVSGSGIFSVTGYTVTPDFSAGTCTVTVDYSYDTNNGVGDTEATLTLTAANGDARSVTIAGHSEALATDDVCVTDTNEEEKYQGDWATAIASYQADGYTFTLLRNVEVTAAATITKTITLDLNGKTLSGAVNNMLTINGTGKTLTIKDSKTGGKVTATIADNATRSVISLAKGKLILESGKIQMNATNTGSSVVARGVTMASGTTFDMNGGTIEAISAGLKPTAVYVVGTFNMTDGTLTTEAGTTTAYTLWINNGTANVTGGTITAHTIQTGSAAVYMDNAKAVLNIQDATLHAIADATNLTKAGSANAYGVYNYTAGGTINVRQNAKIKGEANNSSYGQYGYGIMNRVANCKANILESTGVEIVGYSHYQYGIGISNAGTLDVIGGLIKGETDALHGADYAWGLSTSGTATIHGGEFKGISHKSDARGITSSGATTIEDAILRASTTTSGAYGLLVSNNKTIATGVEIHANATTSTAYGVYLSSSLNSKTGAKSEPEAELNNLTVEATTGTKTASGVTVLTTRRLITSTASGYVPGDYVAKSNVTINGGSYTAIAGTTDAYGVYVYKPAYIADGSETAVASATINNATLVAKTTGANNNAYGIRTGGITTVNGCNITAIGGAGNGVTPAASNVHGIIIDDQKTTVSNTTITSKGLTKAYGIYVNAAVFTSSADASRWPTYGYTFQGEVEVNGNNQITAQTTGGETAYGIYVHAAKANVASGVLAGDHATAGTAVVNGGKFNANASGTPAYAACVADPVLQGDATATPTLIINEGKFKGTAGATPYADVSVNGEPGYFVLNGGYYVKDENLDKKLGEGMNKVAVKSGTPEYTEGYRWRITDNMNGEYVCKIKENSTSYQSLEEALQVVNASPSSTWTIIMIANATLSKGDYNLPQNTTLLIPYLTSQTAIIGTGGKSTSPVSNVEKYEAPYPLYKLTFADGVNMTVHGTIEASAVTYMSNQGLLTHGTGVVSGSYGWLYLAEGSHIDLESTAKLIAWGFVTGKGEINAKSGSKIYEDFQIGDWRGGTVESDVIDNKNGLDSKSVFVITHYYYQNIECPITYRPGATAYGWGGTYMYNNSFFTIEETVPLTEPVAMVGTSDAMFCMSSATSGDDTWVRKEYDPETDYVNWTLNSGASLGSIRIQLDLPIVGKMDVNSSNYVLPITSNFNIVANYGEVALTNHVCFIPGSKLTIKKEATVIIPSGQRAFFYDQDDWSSYSGYWFCPGYSPSWKKNPRLVLGAVTAVKMPDAEVLIEGTLDIRGATYTTAGGANIHSTRENAGKVKFTAAPAASTAAVASNTNKNQSTTLFQFTGNGPNYTGKALNPAKLKNEDGTYSEPTSSNTSAGKTWIYMADFGGSDVYKWTLATENGCMTTVAADATKDYIHPSDWVPVGAVNSNHAYPSEDGTRMFVNAIAPTTNTGCVWWEVNPTPEVIGGTTYYIANNENFDNYGTYYYWDNSTSYWKPKKVTVIWKDKDGNKITNGSFGDLYNFNTSPVFHGTNPSWANSATEKHDWIGWRDEEGNIYDKNATLPLATADVTTYIAYFVTSPFQYTITFKNKTTGEGGDGKVIWSGLMNASDTDPAVCPVTPTQDMTADKVYTFSNWVGYAAGADLPNVTGPATYTAEYTYTTRTYTVTFYNYDGAEVLQQTQVAYGTSPVYAGIDPYRANTSAYSYEWTGWKQGTNTYGTSATLPTVTGDIYYIATFKPTELQYQVFFKRPDGSVIDAGFYTYNATPSAFPANPTMESTVSTDYTFTGNWSPATLQPVTEDGMTYTALFDESPRQYTAHFVNYDGASLNVDQTIDYNTVPAYTGATPFHPNDSRNSYEFSGWAWAAGEGWEAGSIGVGEAFHAIKGDITFTAQFNPVLLQFNVIYQREDGTFIKQDKVKWGQDTEAPAAADCNYEDEQYTYTLSGWSPATIVNPVTTDATYTAQFNHTPRSYSVTLNTNGGTINAGNVTSYTYGTGATLPTNVTRTGYGFSGWYDNSGLTGSAVTNISSTATGNKTYWAKWTAATYNLTYEGLNGATNSNPATYTIETETITLAAPGTREGYTFTGWTCGGSSITQIALGSTGDKTITANWTAITYHLTYEGLNGATNSNPATYTIETETITLADPGTRAGYDFTGWTCGGSPITQITLGSTGDKTITANWEQTGYQVNFVDEDGTTSLGDYPKTILPGVAVTAPAEPTKAADENYVYTFAGWDDGNGHTYASADIPAVSEAVTYTATYNSAPTVASVTVGGATTYYTTIDAAFEAVNAASANMTITLLADATAAASLVYQPASTYTCTLDLNNHTISGAVAKLINVNLAKSTFIITDNSVAKGGKVNNNYNANARVYGVFLTAGTFKLQNGTISSTNPHTYSSASANSSSAASGVYVTAGQTFTMENGTVESASQYASYAIYMAAGTSTVTIKNGLVKGRTTKSTTAAGIYNLGKGLTINGGHIIGHAYTTTAYGVYLNGGHATINGGTIEATNDTTSNKGTTTTYGIYVAYKSSTYKGVLTIPSTSSVNVFAKARTTTAAAVTVGGSSTGSTIAGGTFTAKTKTSSTAYGVYSSGNITISGGTFNVIPCTSTGYGIYSLRGKVTISGSPTFNVTTATTTAYGAFAYGTIGKKGTGKYSGTIEINGGTFNVTSTKETAYGAYAGLMKRDLTKCSATNDTVPGMHYMPGIISVTNGTFNVKATTTGAYGIVVAAAKSESGAVGTTARRPTATITGGNFKVESEGDDNATAYAMNTSATATYLKVQGGKYSTKRTNATETSNIEDKYTAPTLTNNYHVLPLTGEDPYKYEVAEAYMITFKNGDDVLQSTAVKKGATPAYSGATPTKTADAQYTYTFTGWSPAITIVSEAATMFTTPTLKPTALPTTMSCL